jgi:plasmid stability protein
MSERMMMVRMPDKLHKAVRVRAAELGISMSEIVRALLTAWVTGKIELPELQERKQEE